MDVRDQPIPGESDLALVTVSHELMSDLVRDAERYRRLPRPLRWWLER